MVSEQNERNAVREHYEMFAGPTVTNARWFLICMALAVGLLLSGVALAKMAISLLHRPVIILQPSGNGSLDRVQYVNVADYQPGQNTLEYFAEAFVTASYSRIRATLPADNETRLLFLPDNLRKQEQARENQAKWIQAFEQSVDPEVQVKITKVRYAGTRISIDFDKHFLINSQEDETRRESWTVDMTYALMPENEVPKAMVPVNPLGMMMVDVRENKN